MDIATVCDPGYIKYSNWLRKEYFWFMFLKPGSKSFLSIQNYATHKIRDMDEGGNEEILIQTTRKLSLLLSAGSVRVGNNFEL